jgi:hypothetical protein
LFHALKEIKIWESKERQSEEQNMILNRWEMQRKCCEASQKRKAVSSCRLEKLKKWSSVWKWVNSLCTSYSEKANMLGSSQWRDWMRESFPSTGGEEVLHLNWLKKKGEWGEVWEECDVEGLARLAEKYTHGSWMFEEMTWSELYNPCGKYLSN